jgi:hypothetical protein
MLCRVALVRTDVSEELSASIMRVTRISEQGTLAVTSTRRTLGSISSQRAPANVPSSLILVTLMKEALSSSETSVLTRVTRRNIQEDAILHSHRSENLKSYISDLDSYIPWNVLALKLVHRGETSSGRYEIITSRVSYLLPLLILSILRNSEY